MARKLLRESTQNELIKAIAEWQDSLHEGDHSLFIESITFFPYHQGNVSAVIIYREAAPCEAEPITVHQQTPVYRAATESAIFNAMQGGTD